MSKFAKRHYEAIAQICQEYREHAACFDTAPVRNAYQTELEQRLADLFKSDNGQFDRERFMFACRPGSNIKAKTAHLKANNALSEVHAYIARKPNAFDPV